MRRIDPAPPRRGDRRERQWFAWLSVDIVYPDLSRESRWLETVRVEEEYVPDTSVNNCYWAKRRFLEPERKGK